MMILVRWVSARSHLLTFRNKKSTASEIYVDVSDRCASIPTLLYVVISLHVV